jgi:phosphoribosylformylglycinamidine cyclo-ligase
MAPTKIYVKAIGQLQKTLGNANLHAMAHITGGGLTENLPRVLPDNLAAQIDVNSWTFPPVFQWLQQKGHIEQMEMYRTFNCGVGFVVVVPADKADQVIDLLNEQGETAWKLGEIVERQGDAVTYR